jgi:hypothetical protein
MSPFARAPIAMKCFRSCIIALCFAMSVPGRAQEAKSTEDGQTEPAPPAQATTGSSASEFPVEVAGYLSFRYLNDDALDEHHFYSEYSGSLFLSKTIGRWRFHAEFNASNASEFDSEGIHLIPRRDDLSVKLDSGFVNYNARDWLQFQGGFLFIPTYWRTHRYQSTTLTVDEPLIDQTVFPTAFKGGMVHGDRYFGEGGFSYIVYGGVDQQTEFQQSVLSTWIERARSVGGKLTLHLPTRQFFNTFDISYHRLYRSPSDGRPDEIYGGELYLQKNRVELLTEFAHASLDIVDGVRLSISQGYYVQPSYRITRRLFGVFRYDRLDLDSLYASESNLARQSAGLTYRPIPSVSLKLEADRYEPQAGRLPAYYGVTTGIVYFFHLP